MLQETLNNWIKTHQNGIQQHSSSWHQARLYTVGGSSISAVIGNNKFCTVESLVKKKIGLEKSTQDIKMQWGCLFEAVLREYIEATRGPVVGSSLYIQGPPGTSYSPDGLLVTSVTRSSLVEVESKDCIELVEESNTSTEIVLLELKCPYSRIPYGGIPDYYLPQVKMGLDILDLPTTVLFVEGVFRKCALDDLGCNGKYDKSLGQLAGGKIPIAYGIIYLYGDISNALHYSTHFGPPLHSNDFGEAPVDVFSEMLTLFNAGVLTAVNKTLYYADNTLPYSIIDPMVDTRCIGVLPWKLLKVVESYTNKEPGYITPYLDNITEINRIVCNCLSEEDMSKRAELYNRWVQANNNHFSDM
jgi:hypothetical protein